MPNSTLIIKQRAEEAADDIQQNLDSGLSFSIAYIIERALLAQKAEHEAERDELQRQIKNLAPTGRYNGIDIEGWYKRAIEAEAELKRLHTKLDGELLARATLNSHLSDLGLEQFVFGVWKNKRAEKAEAERTDNEEIGAEFLEQLKRHDPSYCWNTTPTEWIVDQINKYDDLKAERDASVAEALERAKDAFLLGFNLSAEGYNGEYPFADKNMSPDKDYTWCARRDEILTMLAAAEADK